MTCCGGFPMSIDFPAQPRPTPRPPKELSGRTVLFGMIGFFAVVIGVNGVMMASAIRTMPGADVKSAYETSQRYNSEIERMQAQAARGWQSQIEVTRRGTEALVSLALKDKAGSPVTGLGVSAQLQHPATRQQDRDLSLTETAPGSYSATVPDLHAGAWTLAVEAKRGPNAVFSARSRIILKD